ncbi:unnamed protein product [Arctia plantaginis]|uniref:Ecdysoneless n=1 Tax=Arctia plantaginis TaxID=874455 RepID=A0A8S1B1J5_ARCPL|nr:unnamed protein product [Arctia plantaginis]CAB3259915.1 unnamed protein product [Arctia plantaginis]
MEPANEETVQCFFFSLAQGSNSLLWEELCEKINDTIKDLSKEYIWQRDEFQVFIPISDSKDTNIPFHLCSITCFGDNIEDEWFIVHLVLEISKLYPNLIIHIKDNDGDFLLIEAADNLQTWVNPSNTDNRVFIYRGHIHLIPPKVAPLQPKLELKAAIKIIEESSELTQVSCAIEQAILDRIGKYPEKLLENIHRTAVQIPSHIAALLILKPSLIAPITNAYSNSDVIDAKCCKDIDFSNCVNVEVTFTKFLYAMLLHSKFINSIKHYEFINDKKSILGAKITCGYQIIMNKASTDLFNSKAYNKFLSNLKQNGYFQNNIEGSIGYNNLLRKAKEYFSIVECPISSHVSDSISQLMSSSDYLRIKDSIKDICVEPGYIGDTEDWLNIHPEQLNDLLLKRYGKITTLKNNDVISSTTLTTELSSFLKQTSDYEGIESHCNEIIEDSIEFEPDQFVSCIEKMLNVLSTGDDENTESEESDQDYDNFQYHDNGCDKELRAKLQTNQTENPQENNTILSNIIQSIKEEKSIGPTSNLLRSFGVHKSELLDSDDD